MEKIEYKGKEYNLFRINLKDICDDDFSCEVLVSEEGLWNAMEDDFNNDDREAIRLDESIFYYLPNGFLNDNVTYNDVIKELKIEMRNLK